MTNSLSQVRASESNIVSTIVSDMAMFDIARVQRVYRWLVGRFEFLGIPVTHVGVPGYGGKNYVSLPRVRKRLEADDWSKFWHLSLMHFKPDRKGLTMEFEASVKADVKVQCVVFDSPEAMKTGRWNVPEAVLANRWHAYWAIDPADVGCDDQVALEHLIEFAKLTVDDYGYLFFMPRRDQPSFYASGGVAGRFGYPEEPGRNRQGWGSDYAHFRWKLLRDVYPYNFLTRPYLNLDVFGSTLEEWVLADAARGTLERLDDKLTLWRPSVTNIPALREELFRAGVIFYYKCFPWTPNPEDVPAPRAYGPNEPIPEMFRAAFYSGRDPALTL